MHNAFQPLEKVLQAEFKFNLSCIKCLVFLIEGLIKVRTVNLASLSTTIPGKAKVMSHYKKLQRFMKEVVFDWEDTARFLVSLFGITNEAKWTVILDRTNWMLGKTHINILYLAVAYKNIAIPICWSFLEDKNRGNSDHLDRIDLLECFIRVFGKECIEVLLGDREFIGKHWLDYLHQEAIPYVLRLKENGQYISNSRGKMMKIEELLRPLNKGEMVNLGVRKVGKVNKERYHVSALRNKMGELVVVIHTASLIDPIVIYKKRWEIETMFRAFKSSGFNMEATHIVDPERLNTLFSVMAIAFCIAYNAGVISAQTERIPLKSHGRKAKSILRTGLDTIQNLLASISIKYNEFKQILAKILNQYYVITPQPQKIVLY